MLFFLGCSSTEPFPWNDILRDQSTSVELDVTNLIISICYKNYVSVYPCHPLKLEELVSSLKRKTKKEENIISSFASFLWKEVIRKHLYISVKMYWSLLVCTSAEPFPWDDIPVDQKPTSPRKQFGRISRLWAEEFATKIT